MASTAQGNEAQATYWSDFGGLAWVKYQDQMDSQLAAVGNAALRALAPQVGEAVLDIGCGCGATTVELAKAVGSTGRAVGLDISGPMTQLASRRLGELGFDHASAMVADAQVASTTDIGGEVDAAFSRFGVMFFADPVAAFANIRALVKPSGRLAFVCWQEASKNPLFGDFGRELAGLFPVNQRLTREHLDRLHSPTPITFRAVLAEAGWSDTTVESHLAPMQLFGTDDFDLALQGSVSIGAASRFLFGADEATTKKIHDAVRRVLESQWSDNGAIVESATWIVSA